MEERLSATRESYSVSGININKHCRRKGCRPSYPMSAEFCQRNYLFTSVQNMGLFKSDILLYRRGKYLFNEEKIFKIGNFMCCNKSSTGSEEVESFPC